VEIDAIASALSGAGYVRRSARRYLSLIASFSRYEPMHRARLVRQLPSHWRLRDANQHRDEQILPMCINAHVRSNVLHDRLPSMRLWRSRALIRDLVALTTVLSAATHTTLRWRAGHSILSSPQNLSEARTHWRPLRHR
jgi:hypothetical protein